MIYYKWAQLIILPLEIMSRIKSSGGLIFSTDILLIIILLYYRMSDIVTAVAIALPFGICHKVKT
jgi:hypothetical protein